jgi:RND family efflux transporter MFP subunit
LSSITKLVIQVICLLFLAVGVGLIAYSRRADSLQRHAAAPPDSSASAPSAALKHLPETGFLGVVLATQTVDLAPRMSGRVETVYVRMGERVNANALIAALDTTAIRHDLSIGEAKFRVARADESRAKTELTQVKDELEALAPLKTSGHISARELAAAKYKHESALASFEAARARVTEAEAQVQQLKQTLAEAQIRAPFRGVISDRYVDPGAMVGPSIPIARLVSADDLRVRFAIPEEVAGAIALGMAIQVQVSALNVPLSGVVENIAPEVDIASRYVYAEGKIESSEAAGLKKTVPSGTVARVSIVAPTHTGAH